MKEWPKMVLEVARFDEDIRVWQKDAQSTSETI